MAAASKKSGHKCNASRGVMTTEFLILGPSLVALMYIAYSANDYIQRRQTLAIASRNAANLYIPGVDVAADDKNVTHQHLQHSFKVDLLGADRADKIVDVITDQGLATAIETDAPAVVTLNEKHLSAYEEQPMPYASNHEFNGRRLKVGGAIAGTIGTVVHTATLVYDGIVNFYLPFINLHVLFDDRPMEVKMNLAMRGDADFFSRSLIAVTNIWGKENIVQSELQSVHAIRHFQRVQAGYHPETYRMQLFIGWMLGRNDNHAWGNNSNGFKRPIWDNWFTALPGHFTTECMFNLTGGSNCRSPSMVAKLWRILGAVRAVLCVLQDIFGGGSCTESKVLWEQAEKQIVDKALKEVTKQIEEQIKNTAKEFVDKKLDELKNKAVDQVKGLVQRELENQMQKFAEGFLDEEDEQGAPAPP
jgi:hypothetical protein